MVQSLLNESVPEPGLGFDDENLKNYVEIKIRFFSKIKVISKNNFRATEEASNPLNEHQTFQVIKFLPFFPFLVILDPAGFRIQRTS